MLLGPRRFDSVSSTMATSPTSSARPGSRGPRGRASRQPTQPIEPSPSGSRYRRTGWAFVVLALTTKADTRNALAVTPVWFLILGVAWTRVRRRIRRPATGGSANGEGAPTEDAAADGDRTGESGLREGGADQAPA